MVSKMTTRGHVFNDIFEFCAKKCKLHLDRAGSIGSDFSSLVFVLWASWGGSGGKASSQDHPKGYLNQDFSMIWNEFLRFWVAPRLPIGAHSPILFRLFCEVRILIDLGKLWAGAGGRGRGLPEFPDSEILTPSSTSLAPPEGGAANLKGFALFRRPLQI